MATTEQIQQFAYDMRINGACILERLVPDTLCLAMKKDILDLYEQTIRRFQINAGLGEIAQWSAHHICGRQDAVHQFLEAGYVDAFVAQYFSGKPYILNTIAAAINPPAEWQGHYEHGQRWHRDGRTFVGDGNRQLVVGVLLLDDAISNNNALEVLMGTHHAEDFPSEAFIKHNSCSIAAPRGTVILFDADLWHRVAPNQTDQFWVAATFMFSRPYFKQQMDYPRFLNPEYVARLSPRMRQLFGFNARVPCSYEEWYQHRENRFYKADQE